MATDPMVCEQCAEIGKDAPAEYVYQAEETSLAGPLLGDPDAWPPDITGHRLLCRQHYAQLPADSRLDYVPTEEDNDPLGHRGEMGTTK